MNYSEAEQYLLNIPRFTTKNEPEKTKAFLDEIGDFSTTIPTIHIAGTNGKGSVCAYLRSALMENGLEVGMFTSPHLVSMRERFMIGNEMISEREFVNVFSYVMSLVESLREKEGFCGYHPTFFEYLFFMASVWFKNKRPDVIVLETGLGGRLDATNSILSPAVCVITEIGLDHCEYLGDTKDLIAKEKAGIIKRNVPVVHWSEGESYDDVIKRTADAYNSLFVPVTKDMIKCCETTRAGIDFSMQSLYDGLVKIHLNTNALYQVENAAVSFETLMVLSDKLPNALDKEKCIEGFGNMNWPGRMERIKDGIIIDGAHNEDGIKAFLKSVSFDKSSGKCLLYSAVSDKNIENVASLITESRLFSKIILCRLESYRAADADRMIAAFKDFDNIVFCDSVREGFSMLCNESRNGYSCYAAGSLYLVGEIKGMA